MKQVSTELAALLESGDFVCCDLYTITTPAGPVLRYSMGDMNVLVGTDVWDSHGVRISKIEGSALFHQKCGFDVDTWQVVFAPRLLDPLTGALFPDKIGSVPFIQAAETGFLDGAKFQVDRAYFEAWPDYTLQIEPVGTITVFKGDVTDIDTGRNQVAITAASVMGRLQKDYPPNVFQSQCNYVVFGPGCTLNGELFMKTGAVGAGSDNLNINATVAAPGGSNTYIQGRMLMTSGANAGFSRTVRDWRSNVFYLMTPFAYDIAVGDTFKVYAGCNHTQAHCSAFGNKANYPGQPYTPAPETSI